MGKAKGGGLILGSGYGQVDVSAVGGGATDTTAGRWGGMYGTPNGFGAEIGVWSSSRSIAATGATLDIYVEPNAFGGGKVKGIAGQGTLNMSGLGESPIFHDNNGETHGVAGQLSIGGFKGHVCVSNFCRRGHSASAGVGAIIEMEGGSYSASGRFVEYDFVNGTKTEGMGTQVGAYTMVNSDSYEYENDRYGRRNNAHADIHGGWFAAGGAATETEQETANGGAKAQALGIYVGAGPLGTDFYGSANGYSQTTTTSFEMQGLTGSINTASAGMATSVQTSNGQLPD